MIRNLLGDLTQPMMMVFHRPRNYLAQVKDDYGGILFEWEGIVG